MQGIFLTKISARANERDVEGLARLLAYGEHSPEIDDFQVRLSSVNSEPAFEYLADSGLIIVKGIKTARIALNFSYEQSNVPEIHGVDIIASAQVTVDTGEAMLYDPNVSIRIKAGTSGKKAGYFVINAICGFKVQPTSEANVIDIVSK